MQVSRGNLKIGRDTLIMNMTSAAECPAKARGLCRIPGICYAAKSERQYPNVLPYRRRQAEAWRSQDVKSLARDILQAARPGVKYLRFSEAGDFGSQRDVNKMSRLADILAPRLRVYGYTARRDLNFSKISKNMIVNGSGFMVSNNFEAIPETKAGDVVCPGDCRVCDLCKASRGVNIKVKYH